MKSSRSSRANDRGVTLVIVLFILVILALVAAGVLTNTRYSANNSLSVQTKNQTFDAAEAGVNLAEWTLDQASATTSGAGSVNGYTYNWEIAANNLSGTTGETVSDPDPEQTAPINVPGGQALLAGWASSILGGRTVYVEAMVATAPPVLLPQGAITCGKTGLISHQQITDTSGHHGANIKCGSLVASGGGQIPDGNSYATGTTNQIIGYNGIAYTDATPPTFLTAKQLAQIQASVLSQASSGGSNYYTAGNINNTTTIGTPAGNCVAYIGGNITLNGSKAMTNYCETTVVMGNVVLSGGGSYTALPASNTHIVYVFGNGGTTVNGNSTNAGIFYVANSDVTLNGAGTGTFTGSIITPNNMTMEGGGTGAFHYNGNETPPPFIPNSVVTLTQWDY